MRRSSSRKPEQIIERLNMQQMPAPAPDRLIEAAIQDVIVRDLRKFTDSRGWLTELFRRDELALEFSPAMAYIFCFLGPSDFTLRMWDNRRDSWTYGNRMTMLVGASAPKSVLIPQGVVHAYQNVGSVDGIVINCPNRLYMGDGHGEPVDEIRYEDDPHTVFTMND